MGIYTAFLDVAMALGSPALGWIAGHIDLGSLFLASAFVVLSTAAIAVKLMQRPA